MKAMIFAAGMGTRLKPLTDKMPKALVPVCGKPLLEHTVQRLISSGVDGIVINVHHFHQQIVDYIAANNFDCEINISDESDELLDTGGGIKKAIPFFNGNSEPFLIHNVDILSNVNLSAFYERNKREYAALLVSNRKSSRNLLFNSEGFLVGWINLRTGEIRSPYKNLIVENCKRYAFSGIHLFSPKLFPLMKTFPKKFSIIDFYLTICDKVQIKADVCNELKLLDVGKQDTLCIAEDFLEEINQIGYI